VCLWRDVSLGCISGVFLCGCVTEVWGESLECFSGVCHWSVSLGCVTEVCNWGVSLGCVSGGMSLGCISRVFLWGGVTEVWDWGVSLWGESVECFSGVCH
jgi:hypothetical protein